MSSKGDNNNTSEQIEISAEEIEQLKELFSHFDNDNDGVLSSKEFIELLNSLGQNITTEEFELIKKIEEVNSGIDFTEFVLYMKKNNQQEETEEDLVLRAFECFDADKDDTILISEFKHILCNIGNDRFTPQECDEIFKEAGINNLVDFNYREFVEFWKNK
jgi:Ca2+-binding EF-hand superfamily protein